MTTSMLEETKFSPLTGYHTVEEVMSKLLELPLNASLLMSPRAIYGEYPEDKYFVNGILYGVFSPHPVDPERGNVWKCSGEFWTFKPENRLTADSYYEELGFRRLDGVITVKELILQLAHLDPTQTLALTGGANQHHLTVGTVFPARKYIRQNYSSIWSM